MIEVEQLTKKFGRITAVDQISFTVTPGLVTAFLGPNGAGKSTTMRMILGLDRPTSGTAKVNGRPFHQSRSPLTELGAMLEGKAVDKSRSARNHLRAVGATIGVGDKRVDEVLQIAGLSDVANKAAGGFSLGMGQRLGIATALLGDPGVIMLDEPVNGLDPDGIQWIRGLLRSLAAEGRTVLVSSHLMSEVEQTADHLIVIGMGKILADMSMDDFIQQSSQHRVTVRSPQAGQLAELLRSRLQVTITPEDIDCLHLEGIDAREVGEIAAANQVVLHQLVDVAPSLEEVFMELTSEAVVFHGSTEVAR